MYRDVTSQSPQQGFMLMVAAIIVFLVLAMGFNMMSNSGMSIQTAGSEKRKTSLFYAADGVISFLAQEIRNGDEALYRVEPTKNDASSTAFSLEVAGGDVFTVGGKQASDIGAKWRAVPQELDGLPRVLAKYADKNTNVDYTIGFDRDIVAYAVFADGIAKPDWMGAAWTLESDMDAPKDDLGNNYQIYSRAKTYNVGNDTMFLGTEQNSAGRGITFAFKPGNDSLVVGGTSVKYTVAKLSGTHYKVWADGYKTGEGVKDFSSRMARLINLGSSDSLGAFPSAFTVRTDVVFGKYNSDWTGKPPVFAGKIYVRGTATIESPVRVAWAGSQYPISYFGYDIDNADGDANPLTGISATATIPEYMELYTSGGVIRGSFNAGDEVWINYLGAGGAVATANYATNTDPPSPYTWPFFNLSTAPNEDLLPDVASVEEFLSAYSVASNAGSGGTSITSLPATGVTEDTLWDWGMRKQVILWKVDMSLLNPSNGVVYIKRSGSPPANTVWGVQLIRCETVQRDITLGTPHPLYTVGPVNINASKSLLLIGDSYTLLSRSWINKLSRFPIGSTTSQDRYDRERSLTLHNQNNLKSGSGATLYWRVRDWPSGYSDANRGVMPPNCANSWEGFGQPQYLGDNYVKDDNDSVTNWFFYDRAGSLFRREPRNDTAGASAANNWNHFDSTIVKAVVVTGWTKPANYDSPDPKAVTTKCNGSSGGLSKIKSNASNPYDPDLARYADAIHYLEAWNGRKDAGPERYWEHNVHIHGSVNLLWASQVPAISWGTSFENPNYLLLDEFHATDWITEVEDCARNGYSGPWGYDKECNERQLKIGVSSNPKVIFNRLKMDPPLFETTSAASPVVGSWRRDYGNLD